MDEVAEHVAEQPAQITIIWEPGPALSKSQLDRLLWLLFGEDDAAAPNKQPTDALTW